MMGSSAWLLLAMTLALSSVGLAKQCEIVAGQVVGSEAYAHSKASGIEDCCARCALSACASFTFELQTSMCYLKNDTSWVTASEGATSGFGRPAPAATKFSLMVDATSVFEVDAGFKCWNIDPSPNREWEQRNLTEAKLHYLAAKSLPGYLRFGGGGADKFDYWCNDTTHHLRSGVGKQPQHCLNQTWFDNFMGFARDSGAKLVFGLDIIPRNGSNWNPTAARRLISYAMSRGYEFFGFELGNEVNNGKSVDEQGAKQQAADFRVLAELLQELYPDELTRPKLIGPDVHGLKNTPPTSRFDNTIAYLKTFVEECGRLSVPLHAITHHEYIEIPSYLTRPPSAQQLDITGAIAQAVNESLAGYGLQIWAGEIGPHNGASPPCDSSSMRWANFADSFWYVDAMALKALNGYAAFCRQDFVGIDYGMLDCATHDPLPDYYASLLWSKLMGRSVLRVRINATNNELRAYAHGAANGDGFTLLLVNLGDLPLEVALNVDGKTRVSIYQLTGPSGTNSTEVALNGKLLRLSAHGQLPPLEAHMAEAGGGLKLDRESITFVQVHGAPLGELHSLV